MIPKVFLTFLFLFFSSLCQAQILETLNEKGGEDPIIIDAEESVVCDENAHKCTATGQARAQKGTSVIYGDVLTVYFKEGKRREITALTADGHVRMETPTETAYGEHAHYDVALDRVIMTGGHLKIVTPKETLTARDSIEYWHTKHLGIAKGNALARFPNKEQLLQANTLVAHFKPSQEENKDGKEKLSIEKIDAEGHVLASGPNGIVTGDRGVYHGQTETVEVFDNVKVTQGGNVMEGGYGRANLKTDVAELFPHAPNATPSGPPKRISGILIPKDVKRNKTNGEGGAKKHPQYQGSAGQGSLLSVKTDQGNS